MTSRRWLFAALVAVVLLAGGALALRGALLAGFGGAPLGLSWLPPIAPSSSTPSPSVDVRYITTTATPSGAPESSLTPSSTPTPEQTQTPTPQPTASPTPQPSFTPTPVPPPPPPTATPTPTRGPQRPTKLGVGVYASGGGLLPQLDTTRPSVILLMDPSEDFAREVRKMFPKAFIMGRVFAKSQPLDNPEARGTAFADLVAQKAVPLKDVVNAWMSYNEVTGHDDYNNYRAYNTFQVAFAKRLQDHYGIAAVAGNDGTGTVEPADYAKYFADAIRTSKYFGVHSYAPAGIKSMRDPTGAYLVLRHRQIKAALDAAGVQSGQFIITESGLWNGYRGLEPEESMADDYIWFAEELNKDPYVLGTTVFGIFQPGDDAWKNFTITGTNVASRIGAYNTEGWKP